MRALTNGIFQRQGYSSNTRIDPNHHYFLAFEGIKTEYQYFSGLCKKKESLGIANLQKIILLQRPKTKEGYSNPTKILQLVIKSLEEYRTGSYSVETIVDHAVDWMMHHDDLLKKGDKIQDMLTPLWKKLKEDGYSPDNIVPDMDALMQALHRHLIELYTIRLSDGALKEFRADLEQQCPTYEPEYDKACIIIDRDPDSFNSRQYDQVIKLCNEYGISPYLSNPCFEFWLLLHFPVVLKLDPQDLLKNKKTTPTTRFLEDELKKIDSSFQKNNLPFEMFEEHIDTAIKNEAKFCEDIVDLKTKLGSNIGKLLCELKSA